MKGTGIVRQLVGIVTVDGDLFREPFLELLEHKDDSVRRAPFSDPREELLDEARPSFLSHLFVDPAVAEKYRATLELGDQEQDSGSP